jgi:hypothetical protein
VSVKYPKEFLSAEDFAEYEDVYRCWQKDGESWHSLSDKEQALWQAMLEIKHLRQALITERTTARADATEEAARVADREAQSAEKSKGDCEGDNDLYNSYRFYGGMEVAQTIARAIRALSGKAGDQ